MNQRYINNREPEWIRCVIREAGIYTTAWRRCGEAERPEKGFIQFECSNSGGEMIATASVGVSRATRLATVLAHASQCWEPTVPARQLHAVCQVCQISPSRLQVRNIPWSASGFLNGRRERFALNRATRDQMLSGLAKDSPDGGDERLVPAHLRSWSQARAPRLQTSAPLLFPPEDGYQLCLIG